MTGPPYAVHWARKRSITLEEVWDLELTVTLPFAPREACAPGPMEPEVRAVLQEACGDRNPGVRAAAERELARMDLAPLGKNDLAGLTILLRRETNCGPRTVLPPAVTDRRGRGRFALVSPEDVYSLVLFTRPAVVRVPRQENRLLAAKRKDDAEGGEAAGLLRRVYELPGRRVTAVLEETPDGGAVLIFHTRAEDLAGAIVNYRVGDETGNVPLARHPGVWTAKVILAQSYAEAEWQLPEFGVVVPKRGGE